MQDNPWLYTIAGILALILIVWGIQFLAYQPTIQTADNLTLDTSTVVSTEGDIVDVKIRDNGWLEKRIPYREQRQYREAAFNNYMTRMEQAVQATQEINRDQRKINRALDGIAGRHYQKGVDSIGQQRYEEAISQFILAIKAEPNNIIIRLLTFKRMAVVYKALNYERRYCVSMIKYLDLLEKFEDDTGVQEEIRRYKREIEEKLRTL
jgi:tetratricopeptide (TPR) repeat protein